MTPHKLCVKDFLSKDRQFSIPVYQRAYSWGKAQWQVFLDDLEEAAKGENHYFFGNVLLEKIENGKFEVIDGQQRLSTIIIFVRCMINALDSKGYDKEKLKVIEEDYLVFRDTPKLWAVEYDRDYFCDVIIHNDNNKHEPQTPSQKRIKEAKEFFTEALKKRELAQLEAIFQAMQNAQVLQLEFSEKKDSVLMFELQNNRGKDLTNMEKLKSYFAYQIYTYSDKDSAESKLNEVCNIFKEIYRVLNDIKQLDEDSILGYFNIAHSKYGFAYRENDDSLNYKKELKGKEGSEAKLAWIDTYMKGLKNAFVDFKSFEDSSSEYKEYLLDLDVASVYPFVIKAYDLFRGDEQKLERVFHILEVIALRHKLVKTGANLDSRLDKVLKGFDSVESLEKGMKNVCDNEWYWTDESVRAALAPEQYKLEKIAPYIFTRYENALRSKEAKTKGYRFTLKDIENPQIEHIAPQTENDEEVASGYCKYDDDFYKNCYPHCIGNLMLIAGGHNSSIGNKPFQDKLSSYEASPLQQQREIKGFASSGEWDKEAINKRHEMLEEWILATWSL